MYVHKYVCMCTYMCVHELCVHELCVHELCVHELCVHVCICTVPMYMCSDCRWVYVKWLKSKELPLFVCVAHVYNT